MIKVKPAENNRGRDFNKAFSCTILIPFCRSCENRLTASRLSIPEENHFLRGTHAIPTSNTGRISEPMHGMFGALDSGSASLGGWAVGESAGTEVVRPSKPRSSSQIVPLIREEYRSPTARLLRR